MGISFKVSKAGTRYHPKPISLIDNHEEEDEDVAVEDKERNQFRGNATESVVATDRKLAAKMGEEEQDAMGSHDHHVSFVLCLYPDGYTIGKAPEGEVVYPVEVPNFLHPYDRASENLFSAIESGRLPGDILDDIPCKYVNGMLVCEVRDYRKCFTEGVNASSIITNKVRLKMTLENVVKDIPLISDNAWTYGDLMEVESRILKALQPKLCLDPKPKLDRLSENPTPNKVNFAISSMRKRARHIAEVTAIPSCNMRGKKVCIDRVPESSMLVDSVNMMHPCAIENQQSRNNNGQNSTLGQRTNSFGSNTSGPVSPLISHPTKHQMGGLGSPRLNPGGQDMMINYSEALNSGAFSLPNKRDGQEGQSSPLSNSNRRHRMVGDGNQQHQLEGFHGSGSQWKNMPLQQQQPSLARGLQYSNSGLQKYSQQVFDGGLNQEAMRYNSLKDEPVDSERNDKLEIARSKSNMGMMESELNHTENTQQSRLQQSMASQVLRSNFPQTNWNSMGHPLESNSRKDRKVAHSPRASTGGVPQSPLSSKSGEFSSGSIGGAAMNNGFLPSQKDRSVGTSAPQIGPSTSWTSSANDSMQRQSQNQLQIAPKRRSNSVPKTPAMSGVGSPASVSNSGLPANVSSPSVGNLTGPDPSIIERFSKIDLVTGRYQLNRKKDKAVEQSLIKSKVFPCQDLLNLLSNDSINENFNGDWGNMPLSKSLVGGSMNVCKVRVLKFMQTERIIQGNNSFSVVPKTQTTLIMSEKQNDGLVAMHIGEIENNQYLAAEEYLPTLPNAHSADLLAAQFITLMNREGYLVDDHVEAKAVQNPNALSNQLNTPGSNQQLLNSNNNNNIMSESQQFSDGTSQSAGGDMAKLSNNNNPNIQNTGMVIQSGNNNNFQGSQGGHVSGMSSFSSRSQQQQQDPMSSLLQQQQLQQQQQQHQQIQGQQSMMMQQPQQQQQQHSQFQRSSNMLAANPASHLNSIGGGGPHMGGGNRPSPLQLQMLQQQAQAQPQQLQQQQQQQLQRQKMMMGLGTVGMGSNIGNNMVGLGGYNNVMGMAGVRGMGGVSGISTPLASMGGMGNMGQNSMNMGQASNISNIAQQFRSGTLTSTQAALMATKLKMAQNRGNMIGNPQSVIGAMTGGGARQMHANQMLNRANINPLQRAVGQMGPPKLMAGMNAYMNQQQQQQLQMHQQQMQLQQQQLQLQQHNNESSSSLQSIVSSPQVGSPSNMGMPQTINQQQASPQQMSQRASMSPQLSSGAMHTINAGNPETACPTSPQLSSQTLGSVSNSPLDMQTVNKNNSAS